MEKRKKRKEREGEGRVRKGKRKGNSGEEGRRGGRGNKMCDRTSGKEFWFSIFLSCHHSMCKKEDIMGML